ncbi:murein biosynthesis integral membrane protein MurJ [Nocardioides bruguierae]|uniref:Murein biosynthesis integral membrane protein MurJ n=1 Tax=Nocardioides bruguierae TaxID=2945102 RepID=A0A9X2D7U4_9ACTN|nr:murein biosynthesis integral membrane protein MurJ [Nocardioides bruguierae]MCM0620966.1 murein biosynthesis integral membrane protein MurJ [Nocardioides bruguierae]
MSDPQEPTRDQDRRSLLSSSAVMAAGTTFSRLSGLIRSVLLAAALGNLAHADAFNVANTVPNMLYILLAGGVFNAVLVPQLVRAMKNDADRGEAYTNRIMTLAVLFLGAVTVALVVAAPWVVALYSDPDWPPAVTEATVDLARYCLPQVFFYGMFVLVGQVLNARGRFGPMMWAPIANNVVSVAVLLTYLVVFGAADEAEQVGGYSTGQEVLLGVGSTLGIAVQLLVLLPYLRAAGFTWRPRFDFRGSGLGHTLRLGIWTVGFVIVNQAAYTVVVRLATSGTAGGTTEGTGYSVYSAAFLIVMVPHSVVTVSLATAVLPRLSARAEDGDRAGVADVLSSVMRTSLAIIVPFAFLLPALADPLARVLLGWGAAEGTVENYVPTIAVFGPGIALFTLHYLVLRGFYALEMTRTVFWIQCVVGAVNVAVAVALVSATGVEATAPSLAIAYACAYAAGSAVSFVVLGRRLGGLGGRRLVGYGLHLVLLSAVTAGVGWGVARLVGVGLDDRLPDKLAALAELAAVGVAAVVVYLVLARLTRLREVAEVLDTVGVGRVLAKLRR